MDWVPDYVIQEMRGSHQAALFMRVDTDPPLHLRFGGHDMPTGIDAVDPDGTVYLGCRLIGLPTLEILTNGKADSVEFTLSGIDVATANQMSESLPEVRGAMVQIGITTLDHYYQPMSKIIPLWHGTASHKRKASPPTASGEDRTVTLGLVVTAGEDGRSRGAEVTWSPYYQIKVSQELREGTPFEGLPDDLFCKNTQRMARGVDTVWPNF